MSVCQLNMCFYFGKKNIDFTKKVLSFGKQKIDVIEIPLILCLAIPIIRENE